MVLRWRIVVAELGNLADGPSRGTIHSRRERTHTALPIPGYALGHEPRYEQIDGLFTAHATSPLAVAQSLPYPTAAAAKPASLALTATLPREPEWKSLAKEVATPTCSIHG